jgi:N-carbamoyl-L-amino-acid hydrolase
MSSASSGAAADAAIAPRTDHERLIETLDALGAIGRQKDRSIDRRAFNEADMAGRAWLIDTATERGLRAALDAAGNVRIWGPDAPSPLESLDRDHVDPGPRPLLIGSHTDSVPQGGTLDGALGVLIGLEVLTCLHERGQLGGHPVEVVSFSDEEGRFGGMFGSRALAGVLHPADIERATDLDGVTLADAMAAHGLDAHDALHIRALPGIYRAYLEVHIEQGPVLDTTGERLGLVTDITGLLKWRVALRGRSDHAGTTPMPMRRDAFAGLAEFAGEIPRLLEEHGGENSVTTIGNVVLEPGAANSVPGAAIFSVDVRDVDRTTLDELAAAMRRALSAIARRRGLMFEFEVLGAIDPVPCDAAVIEAIAAAAGDIGVPPRRMPSGAAHDAQQMAAIAPVGMIFTPSVGGRSHTSAEWTHRDDITLAADVCLGAATRLSAVDPGDVPGTLPHVPRSRPDDDLPAAEESPR